MKIAVLISGGVDSAVVVHRLYNQGHDLHLFYIRIGMDNGEGDCSAEEDIEMCTLIARKYNLVTDFGKFADPLADKMLTTAAMLWFVENGQMPAWVLLIVLVREFAVSGLRMIASDKGRVIAAGWSGKVKTASTMVCIVLMFLPIPSIVNTICVWVITLTTLYSGVEYFMKNKDVIQSA